MAFPANNPTWADEDTYLDGVTPNKIRPDESLRDYGYLPQSEPSAQNLNWMFDNINQQIIELKSLASAAFQTPINRLIFIDGDTRNPAEIYGYGTWIPFGQGRVMLGAGTGTDINGVNRAFSAGATGGEYSHSISTSELPEHSHTYTDDYLFENSASVTTVPATSKRNVGFINGGTGNGDLDNDNNTMVFTNKTTGSVGAGQAMNVVQPFIVVQIWKRIS